MSLIMRLISGLLGLFFIFLTIFFFYAMFFININDYGVLAFIVFGFLASLTIATYLINEAIEGDDN